MQRTASISKNSYPSCGKRGSLLWRRFLESWSAVSIIQPSRETHDVAITTNGAKGFGGVYKRHVFSERTPSRHRSQHIDWKTMFAVLHAFLLWHESWQGGLVRLTCDNTAVVDAINKHSIKGRTVRPLQSILLIAAVFDIALFAFWIPSEENIVAVHASRHDYAKLTDLGLQVSQRKPSIKISTLRQKPNIFFTTPSPLQPFGATILQGNPTISPGNMSSSLQIQ
jgi:hypothetical protein